MNGHSKHDISYIAIDGDDVGPRLREFIISNNIEGAKQFSNGLRQYFDKLAATLSEAGCEIVFCGGDSILAFSNLDALIQTSKNLDPSYHPISIGIGSTPEIAYLSLQLAKARGKSQVVLISHSTAKTLRSW